MEFVHIKCKGNTEVPLESLIDFQSDLKMLSDDNYHKFRDQLLELGFSEPISIWQNEDKNYILNGHMRSKTLKLMKSNGYIIPEMIPVNLVEADDYKQAKKKVLALTSQYGEIQEEGFYTFLEEANIMPDELDFFTFDDIDLDFGSSGETKEVNDDNSIYTNKIKAPVYEPKSEIKPKITELYSNDKFKELTKEIDDSTLDKEVKSFLKLAATRHIVFDYETIAEYYSHSDKEVQDLMEKSALVIIDFKKAYENGYVRLREELISQYETDNDE